MQIALIIVSVVLVAALLAHVLAAWRFDLYARAAMRRVEGSNSDVAFTATRENLPEVVQQFLGRARVAERPARSVHLRQTAELRMAPDKPWSPLVCEQVIAVGRPGFVWYADQRRGPIRAFRVIDAFIDGHGLLEARLLGSIRVARLTGPEADRSELMRYLAELAWAPDALLHNPTLRFVPVAADVVQVEADSDGGVARVRLYFDERGDIVEMQADERGSTENGVVVPRPWRGVFSEYQELGGRRIPTRGEVGYVYDDGYSPYWRGVVTDYELR